MIEQILIGSCVTCFTLLIQIVCMTAAEGVITKWTPRNPSSWSVVRYGIALFSVVLAIMVGVALCCIAWTVVFMRMELFEAGETAVYFTIVTFTTLGYGDVVLDSQWRFLSGMTATNGLIVFGLNTAFLVDVFSRLRGFRQFKSDPKENSENS